MDIEKIETRRRLFSLARQLGRPLIDFDKQGFTCSPEMLRQYGEEEATAINYFLGLETVGTLNADRPPPRLYLGELWRQVSPILKQHPIDRELFIGWDLIDRDLRVTEVVEGRQRAEIQAENERLVKERKWHETSSAWGQIANCNFHTFSFHSHVLDPRRTLPQARYEQVSQSTPPSSYGDLSGLVLSAKEYARGVLDIKLQNRAFPGRIIVALKTTKSWPINEANYKERAGDLMYEMYYTDGFDLHEDFATTVKLPSRNVNPGALEAIKRLQSDEHWWRFAGVVIYRGLLSANPEINSTALRWDLFYQKLMGVRPTEETRKRRWWQIFSP